MLFQILSFYALFNFFQEEDNIYRIYDTSLSFHTDATIELISASSSKVVGGVDLDHHDFGFSVPIKSFENFSSKLQKEHFNEKYLESDKYPNAEFKGKIEGEYELSDYGSYLVIASGMLTLHGISKQYQVPVRINIDDYGVKISSDIEVLLINHDIESPSILGIKLAEKVFIKFDGKLSL